MKLWLLLLPAIRLAAAGSIQEIHEGAAEVAAGIKEEVAGEAAGDAHAVAEGAAQMKQGEEKEIHGAEGHKELPVKSTLVSKVRAGEKILPVQDAKGFKKGQAIIIGEGTNVEEINVIASFGSIVTLYSLKWDHDAATVISSIPGENINKKDYSSTVLLGSIASLMAVYYLVNSPHNSVRHETWNILVTGVSIFVAVMTFKLLKCLVHLVFGFELHDVLGSRDGLAQEDIFSAQNVGLGIIPLVIFYILVNVAIFVESNCSLRLKAVGTIGAHMLGFSAIDLFGGTFSKAALFDSQASFLLLILFYTAVAGVMMSGNIGLFRKIGNDAVVDQVVDTCEDFFGMGLGFLLSQWFRGLIMYEANGGHMAPKEIPSTPHTAGQIAALTGFGTAFLIFSGIIRALLAGQSNKETVKSRILALGLGCCALTSAWCLLDASSWFWLHRFPHSHFEAQLMVAITWSLLFVVVVFLFAVIKSHLEAKSSTAFIRGEFKALALAVGLAWEHLFDLALEETGDQLGGGDEKGAGKNFIILFTLIIVITVYPAWTVYMLPRHDKELQEKYKDAELSVCNAFCGDIDDDDDYDIASDSEE